METNFFVDNKTCINGKKVWEALDRKGGAIYARIEECVLNAKTPLAKRRLVRTIIFVQNMDAPQL